MQLLQPMQTLCSTKTMPSFSRCCIAPVGQALTHHGSSQWKQGMKVMRIRGRPPTSTRPVVRILQGAGPGPRSLFDLAVDLAGLAGDAVRLVVAEDVLAHRAPPATAGRIRTTASVRAQPPPAGSKS